MSKRTIFIKPDLEDERNLIIIIDGEEMKFRLRSFDANTFLTFERIRDDVPEDEKGTLE